MSDPAEPTLDQTTATHLVAASRHFGEAILELLETKNRLATEVRNLQSENEELSRQLTRDVTAAFERGVAEGMQVTLQDPDLARQNLEQRRGPENLAGG